MAAQYATQNIKNSQTITLQSQASEDEESYALKHVMQFYVDIFCSLGHNKNFVKMEKLPIISLREVARHDNISDSWIVICDHVYDITKFIFQHPGGESVLLEQAGRDATFSFLDAGHDITLVTALKKYLIGILPPSERLCNSSLEVQL